MGDVTQILERIQSKDPSAATDLLPIVYEELRRLAAARLAREAPGYTLQPTELVHEAWLRVTNGDPNRLWNSRGHFFGAAAEAMRRILIENARRKARLRHGGQLERVPLDTNLEQLDQISVPGADDKLLVLNQALEELEREAPEVAQLVKYRCFAGFTVEEAATLLDISPRTAHRNWIWAKAWLFARIQDPKAPS